MNPLGVLPQLAATIGRQRLAETCREPRVSSCAPFTIRVQLNIHSPETQNRLRGSQNEK